MKHCTTELTQAEPIQDPPPHAQHGAAVHLPTIAWRERRRAASKFWNLSPQKPGYVLENNRPTYESCLQHQQN